MSKYIEEYESIRPTYERFRTKLNSLLLELINESKIDIVSIESRTKDIKSYNDKIARPDKNYINPLEEITDLCGVRIVTYYTEDIYEIAKLLENEFEIDNLNSIDKIKINSPDKFGYLSLHYVIKLGDERKHLIEWQKYKSLKAEIQIRTILQHSWAAIDHKLRYKSKGDIPSSLKRKIYRLSALLELADEQFLAIKKETEMIQIDINKNIDEGKFDIEINSLSIQSYINNKDSINRIIDIAVNIGYMEELINDGDEEIELYFTNRLILILDIFSIQSIEDLDKLLNVNDKKIRTALKSFLDVFSLKSEELFYTVKADILAILVVMFSKNDNPIDLKKLNKIDWTPFRESIIEIKK